MLQGHSSAVHGPAAAAAAAEQQSHDDWAAFMEAPAAATAAGAAAPAAAHEDHWDAFQVGCDPFLGPACMALIWHAHRMPCAQICHANCGLEGVGFDVPFWGVQGSTGPDNSSAAAPAHAGSQDPFAASLPQPAAGSGALARTTTPQSPDDPFAPAAPAAQQSPRQQPPAEAEAGKPLSAAVPKKSAADILKMFDAPQARPHGCILQCLVRSVHHFWFVVGCALRA